MIPLTLSMGGGRRNGKVPRGLKFGIQGLLIKILFLHFSMKFILFWCKYANLKVCPRGSTAIDMFSILEMSEIAPMGGRGASFFQKCHKLKIVWNFRWGGGGSSLFGNFSQIFNFFLFCDGSPNLTNLNIREI